MAWPHVSAMETIETFQAAPVVKKNWFSRELPATAETVTFLSVAAMLIGSMLFFNDYFDARSLMPSTVQGLARGEYWRLWTALFAHADLGHLLSNGLLFVPLAFFLNGYFGSWLFPVLGFVVGGIANFFTLKTMGAQGSLIGASGVVFWMGATWLTLYVGLETRESLRRRLGKALFIGAALFLPQGYEPQISYMCHLFGFILGVGTGVSYLLINRKKFAAAEVRELMIDEPADWEVAAWGWQSDDQPIITLPRGRAHSGQPSKA